MTNKKVTATASAGSISPFAVFTVSKVGYSREKMPVMEKLREAEAAMSGVDGR